MADFVTFHLVSPEKKLASVDAKSVNIPGIEGDITLLPNHADFLTTLRPGIVQVETIEGLEEFLVTGGFLEVSASVITVLAEKAILKAEVKSELFEPLIAEAEAAAEKALEKEKARADLRVNDLRATAEIFN
jgi:F-type H+-transporting ATPase subunit epsilon